MISVNELIEHLYELTNKKKNQAYYIASPITLITFKKKPQKKYFDVKHKIYHI